MHEEFIPAEGRSVVYQIAPGEWRPAQIVKVFAGSSAKTCNLVVFLDGSNDNSFRRGEHGWAVPGNRGDLVGHAGSRPLGDRVGQYLPRKPEA